MHSLLQKAFNGINPLFDEFEYAVQSYYKNKEIEFTLLSNPFLQHQLEAYESSFMLFGTQITKIENVPHVWENGIFRVDSGNLKRTLMRNPKDCKKLTESLLVNMLRSGIDKLRGWIIKAGRMLSIRVSNVEDFVTQRLALNEVNSTISNMKKDLDTHSCLYQMASKMGLDLTVEDSDNFMHAQNLMGLLSSNIFSIEGNMEKNLKTYRKDLKDMIPDFVSEVNTALLEISEEKFIRFDPDFSKIIKELEILNKKCLYLQNRAKNINKFQECLEVTTTIFDSVDQLAEQVDLRRRL